MDGRPRAAEEIDNQGILTVANRDFETVSCRVERFGIGKCPTYAEKVAEKLGPVSTASDMASPVPNGLRDCLSTLRSAKKRLASSAAAFDLDLARLDLGNGPCQQVSDGPGFAVLVER